MEGEELIIHSAVKGRDRKKHSGWKEQSKDGKLFLPLL